MTHTKNHSQYRRARSRLPGDVSDQRPIALVTTAGVGEIQRQDGTDWPCRAQRNLQGSVRGGCEAKGTIIGVGIDNVFMDE